MLKIFHGIKWHKSKTHSTHIITQFCNAAYLSYTLGSEQMQFKVLKFATLFTCPSVSMHCLAIKILYQCHIGSVGRVAQSVQWLAMAWMVWGSNPSGVRFSAPVQTGPGAPPASCIMGTRSFPGVKSGRGVTLTPHPLLVQWSWKSRAIPLIPL